MRVAGLTCWPAALRFSGEQFGAFSALAGPEMPCTCGGASTPVRTRLFRQIGLSAVTKRTHFRSIQETFRAVGC